MAPEEERLTQWGLTARTTKASKPPRTFYGEYPLTGLMHCPQCGGMMVAGRTHNKLKSGKTVIRRYYVCEHHRNKGKTACRANGINADMVEAHVMGRMRELVLKPKILEDLVGHLNDHRLRSVGPLRAELDSLKKRIDQGETKQREYFELYEASTIDSAALTGRLEELRGDAAGLHSRRMEVERQLRDCDAGGHVHPEAVRGALERFGELLSEALPEQRKALFQLVIQEIKVTKDRKIASICICFNESIQPYL